MDEAPVWVDLVQLCGCLLQTHSNMFSNVGGLGLLPGWGCWSQGKVQIRVLSRIKPSNPNHDSWTVALVAEETRIDRWDPIFCATRNFESEPNQSIFNTRTTFLLLCFTGFIAWHVLVFCLSRWMIFWLILVHRRLGTCASTHRKRL